MLDDLPPDLRGPLEYGVPIVILSTLAEIVGEERKTKSFLRAFANVS